MMIEVSNMNDAVRMAQRLTEKVIRFYCPLCASFDLFENYEDRGINSNKQCMICRHNK
jgi:UDP-N-acetylmuramoylalanine--D-glutamate ligase